MARSSFRSEPRHSEVGSPNAQLSPWLLEGGPGEFPVRIAAETVVIPGDAQAAAVLHNVPRWFFLLYDVNTLNCPLVLPP